MSRIMSVVLAAAIGLSAGMPVLAAGIDTINSSMNGVTIVVTPKPPSGSTVEFRIVVDTHSQELTDDFLKSAALIDSAGNRYLPIAWEGPGPGGHHREGVLRFGPLPATNSLELQISRPQEPKPRTFRWQLQ